MSNAEKIVQLQMQAYNAHNLEAYLDTFSADVELFELPAPQPVISGKAALQRHYKARFAQNPDLWADVTERIILGNFVIYHERLHGLAGSEPTNIIAVYQVDDNLIQRIWFIRGES